MSKQKETSLNPELKKIFDFIKNQFGFQENEDGIKFTKETIGSSTQIIINGQRTVQPGSKHTTTIKYIGEGSIKIPGDNSSIIPIWGFEIYEDDKCVNPTEYVENLEQFKSMFS